MKPNRPSKRSSELEVSVHTLGGVFGDDRLIRIVNQTITVTNHGAVELQSEISDRDHQQLTEVARRLTGVRMPRPADAGYVPDGGSTTIDIALPNAHRRIVLNAGDDAPQQVWDLLDALERVRRQVD